MKIIDDVIKTAFFALQTNVRWRDDDSLLAAHGVKYYYAEGGFYVLRFGDGITARYAIAQANSPYSAYCKVIEGC